MWITSSDAEEIGVVAVAGLDGGGPSDVGAMAVLDVVAADDRFSACARAHTPSFLRSQCLALFVYIHSTPFRWCALY